MKLSAGVKGTCIFFLAAVWGIIALPAIASTVTGTIESGVGSGGFNADVPYRPTASVSAGTYTSNQSVVLSSAGATSIRYTVDGTQPSCSSGNAYSTAITISSSTTLKAIACKGAAASSVATFAYVLQCATTSVSHGTVGSYSACTITCDSGYTLSGSTCRRSSGGSGGSSGGGGSVASVPVSATGIVSATGGSVNLAATSNSLGVSFTAPAGSMGAGTTVTIAKVSNSSSSYVPPAGTSGLFMVGGNAFQITAASGSAAVTNFNQPITLAFTYTLAQIPAGTAESNLKIYYYDTVAKAWTAVASTVNTATHTITATVNHLTQFAIFGTAAGTVAAPSDKAALIAQIQTQLLSLIAQLKVMVGDMVAKGEYVSPALMAFAPNASAAPQTVTTPKITMGWSLGKTGEEVKTIQAILARDAAIYPEGIINGYFGPATQAAVQKFQVKYGIAKNGDAGYGNVGPATRAKMNAM